MLGCESVLDGRDDALSSAADVRAFRVVDERVDRAEDESAAVEMDEDGVGTGAGGNEDTDPDLAAGDRNPLIGRCANGLDRDPSAPQFAVELVPQRLAQLGQRQRAVRPR